MKHILTITAALILCMATAVQSRAHTRKLQINCTNPEAEIYANGKFMGKGSRELLVQKNVDLTVKVSLTGYLTETRTFYYRSGMPAEKAYTFDLKVDDAYEASAKTELANTDIGINTSKKRDAAWEALTHVILLYFEVPEQMDERAGYLRTAWITQSYAQSTVRTRVIVRTASLDPLSFRVKLVSEIADRAGVKGNDDDRFRVWDRLLRKYEPLIAELQARLK